MISGIGTDIVDIKRIKKAIKKHGDKFLEKILSKKEINKIPTANSEQFIAGRFAAKEALIKASGVSFSFTEVTILNDKTGKPYVETESNCLFENYRIHLSISHENNYAIAFAITEK